MAAEAFPLAWPVGWPRTPTVKRGPSRFGKNLGFCPANKILTTTGKLVNDGETILYRAKTHDCRGCLLKAQCCPKASVRKIPRSIYEEARDVARALAKTEAFKQSCRDRKRVEMLFASYLLARQRQPLAGNC